ncbi:MAG: carboxy-S-adenosyl-L-methionine synthase CmoA [Pseudomonadota bacterium]
MPKDQLFQSPRDLVDFRFDAEVVGVFPDMIRRSVPGYETVLPLAALIVSQALPKEGRVYDLGSSLGASSLALLNQLPTDHPVSIIGIDSSEAMVTQASSKVRDPRLRFLCADVRSVNYEPCQAVLSNYLLQFLPVEDRAALLARLYAALTPGGCLVLTEKIHLDDDGADRWADAVHLDFKRANGYSELEVAQKRAALERVMPIEAEAVHRARLEAQGFTEIRTWFRCLNWASFVAWKSGP